MGEYKHSSSTAVALLLQRQMLTYLQARLAVNAVTLGDYERPLEISQFIKDVHAGFQILNLKNDMLRRRTDGIKYNVSTAI
jgi:hypothetical protein